MSLLRAFLNIRRHVIEAAGTLERWEQALLIDHHLSVEVQVGGARRAARMATKSWRDPDILRFIRAKSEGGLWTANHSVMVDAEFWQRLQAAGTEPLTGHAQAVFEEATRCAWINGSPRPSVSPRWERDALRTSDESDLANPSRNAPKSQAHENGWWGR